MPEPMPEPDATVERFDLAEFLAAAATVRDALAAVRATLAEAMPAWRLAMAHAHAAGLDGLTDSPPDEETKP